MCEVREISETFRALEYQKQTTIIVDIPLACLEVFADMCLENVSKHSQKIQKHPIFDNFSDCLCNFLQVRLAKSSRSFIKLCRVPFEGKVCSFLCKTYQNEPEGVQNRKHFRKSEFVENFVTFACYKDENIQQQTRKIAYIFWSISVSRWKRALKLPQKSQKVQCFYNFDFVNAILFEASKDFVN